MNAFILSGEILHPGSVRVEASTMDEAIAKAEDGVFEVWNEDHKFLTFVWDGGEPIEDV